MKKIFLALPLCLAISACGTFSSDKIKAASDKPVDKQAEVIANSAPNWYFKPPSQEGYIFGVGTSRSKDLEMAKEKALTIAQGKIAEAVGGQVSKQTKIFKTEAGSSVIETSNSLVKKLATNVDFTGTEVKEVVLRLEQGGYYRVYVLTALPLGENNLVVKHQMEAAIARTMASSSSKESKELEDAENSNKTKPAPNRMLGETGSR